MNIENLKYILKYFDVIEMLGTEVMDMAAWRERMGQKDVSERTVFRYQNELSASSGDLICVANDQIYINREMAKSCASEFSDLLGVTTVHELEKEIAEANRHIESLELQLKNHAENQEVQDQAVSGLRSVLSEKEETIRILQNKCKELETKVQEERLKRSVVLLNTLRIGPASDLDLCFLKDPDINLYRTCAMENEPVEIPSYMDEMPDDPEVNEESDLVRKKPGRKYTPVNCRLKGFMHLVTEPFLKKKVKEMEEARKAKEKSEAKTVQVKKEEIDPVEKARQKDVQQILDSKILTNKEKLAAYALFSKYRGTEMDNLLSICTEYCLNANAVIEIFERSERYGSYENMRNLLLTMKDASEYRLKYDLAKELIEGKWYIVAMYNNKQTKFQLVPISELNDLRNARNLPESEFSYPKMVPKEMLLEENKEDSPSDQPDKSEKTEKVEGHVVTAADLALSPEVGIKPAGNATKEVIPDYSEEDEA